MARRSSGVGSVALVGAGPGDPGLITVRGLALLRSADVVVHDRLVAASLLEMARIDAEVIDAGKARGAARTQAWINSVLISRARAGGAVVRLKGGDPLTFARGGEEAAALARAAVPFEIVPGVSAALGAPAAAGIPPTLRGVASTMVIATGHERWRPEQTAAIARMDTIVVLMAVENLADIARALVDAGRLRSTPAALVQDATLPTQRTVVGTLGTIATVSKRAGLRAPAVLVIGDVTRQREFLGGWDTRPLSGIRVLVTRAREQASELSALLLGLGAQVIEAPSIRIEPARAPGRIAAAVKRLRDDTYAWVVFTSANGVRALGEAMRAADLDARAFGRADVAAIGPGTARALLALGIVADLVPEVHTTAALGHVFPSGTGRILLARAEGVDRGLDEALRLKGWMPERVVMYRITKRGSLSASVRSALRERAIDVITFASAGTVAGFRRAFPGEVPRSTKIVCIGPVTARAARAAGLRVSRVAEPHTLSGLVSAVQESASRHKRANG